MTDDVTPVKNDEGGPDYLSPMIQLQQQAMSTIQTQDLQEITILLQKGKTLYKKASDAYGAGDFQLGIMNMCMQMMRACYLLVKATYSKMEEKFEQTLTELEECDNICQAGPGLVQELTNRANDEWLPALGIYDFLFRFLQCFCRAEKVEMVHEAKSAKGEFSDHEAVLRQAAQEYRKINEVDLPLDDFGANFPALVKMLTRLADIREDKADRVQKLSGVLKHLPVKSKKIFLIHGHGEALLLELKELLEKKLKLECVVLKKESNQGDSVMEKFEKFAGECGYAFAILSPDDTVDNSGKSYFQARPNVLFELGWFHGRYGRRNVCILKQKEVLLPSDLGGIICLEFDKKIAEVYLDLENELASIGFISA